MAFLWATWCVAISWDLFRMMNGLSTLRLGAEKSLCAVHTNAHKSGIRFRINLERYLNFWRRKVLSLFMESSSLRLPIFYICLYFTIKQQPYTFNYFLSTKRNKSWTWTWLPNKTKDSLPFRWHSFGIKHLNGHKSNTKVTTCSSLNGSLSKRLAPVVAWTWNNRRRMENGRRQHFVCFCHFIYYFFT